MAQTSIKQKIGLILLGLFLSAVLLEFSLRFGGFILLSLQEYKNRVSIRQKGTYRIMCLGESTTQGQYPHFLEEILNRSNIGIQFSVIDKGIGGASTSYILSNLEPNLDTYHPDMIITMMGINDRGSHMPQEHIFNSRITEFLKSFKIYKLTRLLWLHIITKADKNWFYKSNNVNRGSGNYYLPTGGNKSITEEVDSNLSNDSLKKTVLLNSKSDNDYVNLGIFYHNKDSFYLAEQCFKKAIELNSKNDRAYLNLGSLYRNVDDNSKALIYLNKAIESNPVNDEAYAQLGWYYSNNSQFKKAEMFLSKSIRINPNNNWAYCGLAFINYNQGKIDQAGYFYKKAMDVVPKSYEAYVEAAWFYEVTNNYLLSEACLKKAIYLFPERHRAYGAIAVLYEKLGDSKLAKDYYRKAGELRTREINPITVDNYYKLKEILDRRKIKLVCAQYPMRKIYQLKSIFQGLDDGVIFVDNESVFKEALIKGSYKEYFIDNFGGDFGHCTDKGNRLLAENIANVILQKVFNRKVYLR